MWYFPKKCQIYFSSRRRTNQTSWRRSGPENIHLDTASTNSRRKSHWFSLRIRRVSSTTSRLVSVCRWSDKWLLVHVRKLHFPSSRWTKESNFTRREKNHSLFHWFTLMYPELLIRIWMSSKSDASMIIGTLMGQETCLVLGQVSLNLLYWKKTTQTDICGTERDQRENSFHPGQIIYGQNSGRQWERTASWRRGRSGRMKSSISITHENCEEFISLTLRTRNSKRPSRMLARNWKHQLLLRCLAKLWRRIVGVVHPTKLKTRLACILEADEYTRLRMGESLPNHHEDHIAGKGNNSLQH